MNAKRKRRASPKSPPLPLVNSEQVVAVLRRLGFSDGPAGSGSHHSMHRPRPDGGKDVTVVVLNRNPVPRGTLTGILRLANVSNAEFLRALGKKH